MTSATEPDQVNIEHQVWLRVTHRMRAPYSSSWATTDDESDGKEEEQPHPRRRAKKTSGRLITMDTTTIKQVLWFHELVFKPECQPASYESLSCM